MRQDDVTNRRLTWSLVAIGVAGILGVGAAVGLSAADASTTGTPAVHRAVAADHAQSRDDAERMAGLPAANRRAAALRALRARVVAAVLRRYPQARILALAPRRDGGWVVTLVLKPHRIGTVPVDRRLHVGAFTKLPGRVVVVTPRPAATAPQPGTSATAGTAPAGTATAQPGTTAPQPAVTVTQQPSTSTARPGSPQLGGDGALSGNHW